MAKTIVGSFDSFEEAQGVFRELQQSGFSRDDVSIIANNSSGQLASSSNASDGDLPPDAPATLQDTGSGAATGAAAGGVLGGAAGLVVGLMGLAIPGIGPIVAAGPLAAALAGAGVGALAGGLIGGLTGAGVAEDDANYYAEAVRRGGALVTVRADDSLAEEAARIMRSHGAVDIERRADQWRQEGWTRHDPSAEPYSVEELERQRSAYRGSLGGTAGENVGTAAQGRGASSMSQSSEPGGSRSSSSMGTSGSAAGSAAMSQSGGTSMGGSMNTGSSRSGGSGMSGIGSSDSVMDRNSMSQGGATTGIGAAAGSYGVAERGGSATGSSMQDVPTQYSDQHREHFRMHHGETHGDTASFDEYEPAYRYGWDVSNSDRYRGRSWNEVEPELRSDWERRYPEGGWERLKAAVRRGWERTSDTVEDALPGDSDRDGR